MKYNGRPDLKFRGKTVEQKLLWENNIWKQRDKELLQQDSFGGRIASQAEGIAGSPGRKALWLERSDQRKSDSTETEQGRNFIPGAQERH